MKYFISCEGDTEQWYFEWLQKQINSDSRTKEKVDFEFKNHVTPSSFAKSNNNTFTKGMIQGSVFCRIQDIEDYSSLHIDNFHNLLKSNKEAKRLFKKYNFVVGYSNFTFEVWIISHKARVANVVDRAHYFKQINKAYNKQFKNNDDYKHKKNFDSILQMLTLDTVINNALPECKRFKNLTYQNNPKDIRQIYGFKYILNNPDTTLNEFVELVLHNAGVI